MLFPKLWIFFFFLNIHEVVLVIDEETLLASFQTTKTCAHTQICYISSFLPWFYLVAGSCGPCHSVNVCWWVASACPGWLGEEGCLHAAWPQGKPAWLLAEQHTTAARSERDR